MRAALGKVCLPLLALALATLGIATPGARLPAVAMGNLLGGFVMLALCWRLVASTLLPGQTVDFVVLRGGKRTTVPVTLADRPRQSG